MERLYLPLGLALLALLMVALGVAWWKQRKQQIARNKRRRSAQSSSRFAPERASPPAAGVLPATDTRAARVARLPEPSRASHVAQAAQVVQAARSAAGSASPAAVPTPAAHPARGAPAAVDRTERIAELERTLARLAQHEAAERAAHAGGNVEGWQETRPMTGPDALMDFAATMPVEFDRGASVPRARRHEPA